MKKYCLIGEKLSHSMSPMIHKMFFEIMNINADYCIREIDRQQIKNCREILNLYDGINVTIPYKQEIMSQLDSISLEASEINAVNTISGKNQVLKGYNSDPYGFGDMLEYNQIDIIGKKFVILGNGGASKSVLHYLKNNGAGEIIVVTRNQQTQKHEYYNSINFQMLENCKADVIINTTPVGMFPNISFDILDKKTAENFDVFVDLVYNPFYTEFCKLGTSQNKVAICGLYMLVAQAIKSQEIWQEKNIDKTITNKIYCELLKHNMKQNNGNIYLVGIMSCGKSTVGKMLSQQLEKAFVDMDEYIEKISGESIQNLFKIGEKTFREWECRAVYELSLRKGLIVATGGGCVVNKCNVSTMRLSGTIIWLDKNINEIAKDIDCQSRPLLTGNANGLFEIYEKRKTIYSQSAHYIIKNDGTAQECVDKIANFLK